MTNKLLELLNALGRDAALAAEYESNPDAVLARYGLSDEEKAAMKSCDCAAVGRLCGTGESFYANNTTIKAYDNKNDDY
ncbi:MAG: hypothetical protein COW59_00895 [Lysobacterales bacterium CG17_big_fil_post_rev_8_21_14_2_50_64_11]|nr:MAG: hypothetical protein COW59_00895 [Xanthomonadales bacterium CG17_big_fil_post_rev_8_21_14_2_50_64_11]PIX61522.1 MAG: hypothetical protein COZ47_01515 [Xanthomonadales bacterium CG_4_10_14_3_um_filter_64_11]